MIGKRKGEERIGLDWKKLWKSWERNRRYKGSLDETRRARIRGRVQIRHPRANGRTKGGAAICTNEQDRVESRKRGENFRGNIRKSWNASLAAVPETWFQPNSSFPPIPPPPFSTPSLGKYSNACLEEAKKGENFVFLYFLSFLSFDSKGRSITQFTQLRSEVSRFRLVYSITRQAMISDSRLSLIRETLPKREREKEWVCVLKGNVDARSSGENTKFINIRSWAEKEEEGWRGGGRRDN